MPAPPDGRHYNVELRDGNVTGSSFAQLFIPALGTSIDFAAGYNRIHQVETVLGGNGSGVGLAAGCQFVDMSDQTACLAQADPCSIGYGGDSGKAILPPNSSTTVAAVSNPGTSATGAWSGTTGPLPFGALDSVRVGSGGTYPTAATVQVLGQAGEYQLARKLYFNSLVGFANIANTTGDPSATDELTLAKFEAGGPGSPSINALLVTFAEFTFGNEFVGAGPDPQFCEDFNEQVVCNDTATAPANVNGCVGNPAGIPAGLAGAAGSNTGAVGANQAGGTSTICGDGIRQAYEECDNGSLEFPANGHATGNSSTDLTPGGCSPTCRCTVDFNVTTGVCN
jgi:hypothetical protein